MFKLKYKYFAAIFFFILLTAQLLFVAPKHVSANHDTCPDTAPQAFLKCKDSRRQTSIEQCFTSNAGNNTAIASCAQQVANHFDFSGPGVPPALPGATKDTSSKLVTGADCKDVNLDSNNCNIIKRLNQAINILSALVGIVVTIMIIIGGIQYTTAGEDPNAVAKAKKHISQAILALVGYGITFAFLQYIIPGGLL